MSDKRGQHPIPLPQGEPHIIADGLRHKRARATLLIALASSFEFPERAAIKGRMACAPTHYPIPDPSVGAYGIRPQPARPTTPPIAPCRSGNGKKGVYPSDKRAIFHPRLVQEGAGGS